MAAEAIAGRAGVNVDGYRDYRGVPVVGAWKWLPDGDIGVVTEIDYAEAFRPLTILRWTFWGLFALLALSCGWRSSCSRVLVARLRREAQKAAIEAQQIGQYKLEQKLGAGGMGVVYKGHHAMLRRPTAIKMLDVDKVNDGVDRAVRARGADHQPAQQSEHRGDLRLRPHAGGRVLLRDGVSRRHRPAVARRALRPAAGAARDSHSAADLRLAVRGPFAGAGASRHQAGQHHAQPPRRRARRGEGARLRPGEGARRRRSRPGSRSRTSLTGTPLYMSPEAIQLPNSVDARSDLYAVGAVGYFLLTGQPVFEAESVVDLCQKHVAAPPTPPSERVADADSGRSWKALCWRAWKSRAPSGRRRPATWRCGFFAARKRPRGRSKTPTPGGAGTNAGRAQPARLRSSPADAPNSDHMQTIDSRDVNRASGDLLGRG